MNSFFAVLYATLASSLPFGFGRASVTFTLVFAFPFGVGLVFALALAAGLAFALALLFAACLGLDSFTSLLSGTVGLRAAAAMSFCR